MRHGHWGIKVVDGFQGSWELHLKANTLDAVRKAMNRELRGAAGKRSVKMWTRTFPDRPVTRFGAEQRMGKGKGNVDHYACAIRKGMFLFELADGPKEKILRAFKFAKAMLPFHVRLVEKPRTDFYNLKAPMPNAERMRRKPASMSHSEGPVGLAELLPQSKVAQ